MKVTRWGLALALCILGLSEVAAAEGEIRVRAVDVYLSGFGGYSFPNNMDQSISSVTVRDIEVDNSPSFGGKIGMWFTAPRKSLGIDIGTEIDVTNFNPDTNLLNILPLKLNATYFGIQVLARVPVGITADLPNGRWFPYVGIGGGGQRVTMQASGSTEGRSTAPAFQALGGIKMFLTRHIAVFAEGKFIHASHSQEVQGFPDLKFTIDSVHGVGGLSVHF
jgi:opacity protein-like surface antigen